MLSRFFPRRAGIGLARLLYSLWPDCPAADHYRDLLREGLAGDAATLMRMI